MNTESVSAKLGEILDDMKELEEFKKTPPIIRDCTRCIDFEAGTLHHIFNIMGTIDKMLRERGETELFSDIPIHELESRIAEVKKICENYHG